MSQTNAEVLVQPLEDKALMIISFTNTSTETSTAIVVRAARIIAAWLCAASGQVSAVAFSGLTVTLTHAAGVDGSIAVLVDPLL